MRFANVYVMSFCEFFFLILLILSFVQSRAYFGSMRTELQTTLSVKPHNTEFRQQPSNSSGLGTFQQHADVNYLKAFSLRTVCKKAHSDFVLF